MAAPVPQIALRSIEGISFVNGSPPCHDVEQFEKETSRDCKVMAFSRDGSLFAWCNSACITIVNTTTGQEVQTIPKSKTRLLSFSPLGTFLSTWETYTVAKNNPQASKNLEIWEVKSGNLVASFAQKKEETWEPRWTDNEEVCSRSVTNEVHCFHDANFETIATKLRLQGVGSFELSRGPAPFTIAAYVGGTKGAPAHVRLYRHPNFDAPGAILANRSFFKADSVKMKWNNKGTAVLVLTATDEDKSGASYYGEQTLHYMNTSGDSNMIQLAKKGPIYDVQWSPTSKEFCVVYGYMPSKATLYNIKCDPIFDFGTGPRCEVHYNPQGNIFCICGFGNLPGWMEIWSRKDLKMISKPQAADTTYFEWSPDGEHILTATTNPRLREGNGYKIWHYSGSCHFKKDISVLYQAKWRPYPEGVFPEKPVSYKIVAGDTGIEEPKAKGAYVPPHLRAAGKTKPQKIERDEELPQNLQKGGQESLSKAALKNKKKREAKARAKEEQQTTGYEQDTPVSTPSVNAPSQGESVVDDKKLRNLKKKLRQVEELKQQQRSGKKLEVNQLDKIKAEAALIKEIQDLELG